MKKLNTKKLKKSKELHKYLSDDDISIARQLLETKTNTLEELGLKFDVHPRTIANRLSQIKKINQDDNNPLAHQELASICNLLITYKKKLAMNLAKINFDDIVGFDDIIKALKNLTSIFSPLHSAYRLETAKTGQVQVNLTQIIEKNWENEEERKRKMIDVLKSRQIVGKKANRAGAL